MTVAISPKINYAAFNQLLYQYLGPDGKLSVYAEKKQIRLRGPIKLPSQTFQKQFLEQTGFTLLCDNPARPTEPDIDFNRLQAQIRQALQSCPLKKIGLHGTEIVLHFDFPDVIEKNTVLRLLSNLIPEPLTVTISPKVNQAAFSQLLYRYLGPDSKLSVYTEKKQIRLRGPVTSPSQTFLEQFLEQTGFTLLCVFQ
ncbi:MAG: hypothetical protein GY820_29755 [Gammaproteobacteria bacterium]|nr:hypothetical protein [Gammaproteobacteria bacterium]